jgi:membrane-bound lytic murein transglycosylase D
MNPPQFFLLALTTLALLAGCANLDPAPAPDAPKPTEVAAATPSAAPLPPLALAASAALLGAETAPPAAVAVDDVAVTTPRRPDMPRIRLDPSQDSERSDLWQRIRRGYAMPDLDDELVRKWEQYYAGRPDYVQRMTERGGRYLFHVVEEIERRGMPTDLALLPFIESAFNPQAMSHARASGMWQFMPATGKDFELQQNLFRDDRRDVLASTRAALDYLQRLHDMFNDWHLALAAYNWGQGSVQRAISRNSKLGLATDYSSLRMPDETRNYVPKLQAVKNIIARPTHFSIQLPALENHPFFLSVAIERDMDVALAARLAGLSLEEFQFLNPQMNKPVILAAGTPRLLLPYNNANRFVRDLSQHRGALASWTAWVAPKTIRPADAARQVGMPEAELREVNRIPARMLVKAGSTLLVPRGSRMTADVSEHIADHAMMALAPEARPLRRLAFKAGKQGESVVAVAKRYRLTPAQVAQWNDVGAQSRFKAGQTVILMLPPKATRVAAKGAAARKAAKPAPRTRVAQQSTQPPR